MVNLTKLLFKTNNFGDSLRYHPSCSIQKHGTAQGKGPVVAWNITRTCNLYCQHCYSNSTNQVYPEELTTKECEAVIDDLALFQVPVLLISGGEPLTRPDIFPLMEYAIQKGIRVTLSTNGTLIDANTAKRLKKVGVSYVGISLDGLEKEHDAFRGRKGAFQESLRGIRNCLAIGQKVGLRFTLNKRNLHTLESIFKLIEEENIPRACFYHLVYSGRGSFLVEQDISPQETRDALNLIIDKTSDLNTAGKNVEILTVDNHADGVYLYIKLKEANSPLAQQVFQLLSANGGNRSGIAIGNIDYQGNIHPDQFTGTCNLGNVREQPFSQIWQSAQHPILAGLRKRKEFLKGRCAECAYLEICNGNFRARAQAIYEDFWESDPACYLSDQEISSLV